MSRSYKHCCMRIAVMLFCHLRWFLNLYSESLGIELSSLVLLLFCLPFLAVTCQQIQWHTGYLYVAKQEVLPSPGALGTFHLLVWKHQPCLPQRGCSRVLLGSAPSPGGLVWASRQAPSFQEGLGCLQQLEVAADGRGSVWMAMPRAVGMARVPRARSAGWCRQPQIHARLRGSGPRFIIACWHLLAAPRTISGGHERVLGSKLLAPKLGDSFWESREWGMQADCAARLARLGPIKTIPFLCRGKL